MANSLIFIIKYLNILFNIEHLNFKVFQGEEREEEGGGGGIER